MAYISASLKLEYVIRAEGHFCIQKLCEWLPGCFQSGETGFLGTMPLNKLQSHIIMCTLYLSISKQGTCWQQTFRYPKVNIISCMALYPVPSYALLSVIVAVWSPWMSTSHLPVEICTGGF